MDVEEQRGRVHGGDGDGFPTVDGPGLGAASALGIRVATGIPMPPDLVELNLTD